MADFLAKQWADIKGNVKWDLIKLAGASVITLSYIVLQKVRHMQLDWWVIGGLFVVSLLAFLYLGRHGSVSQQLTGTQRGSSALITPTSNFNLEEFFRVSFNSIMIPEAETNVLASIQKYKPEEREGHLVKIIAIGVSSYEHQITWLTIFRSQILLVTELNAKGFMSFNGVKGHYDTAANQWSDFYVNYPFEQWLSYLRNRKLILQHPNNSFEITVGGKDFLKYMVHCGYTDQTKNY
jgi:hypothetical protein